MHVLTVDEHLVDTAKARGIAEREMAVSAEQLFATFEDEQSWPKWVPGMREATWTSPKPFGGFWRSSQHLPSRAEALVRVERSGVGSVAGAGTGPVIWRSI